jgi:hypothetical protein
MLCTQSPRFHGVLPIIVDGHRDHKIVVSIRENTTWHLDFNNINPGESKFLVPPGVYPARFLDREAKTYVPWGEKLVFRWQIFTAYDLSSSITLYRYYNLERDGGGRFMFGDGHHYWKDWVAANDGRRPIERKRLPPSKFENKLSLVRVVTVTSDQEGPLCSALTDQFIK